MELRASFHNTDIMKKTYYPNEYYVKQWTALIDKAAELGCNITYNIYGTACEIDSTSVEDRVMVTCSKDGVPNEEHRLVWAEVIHNMIQEALNTTQYKVVCNDSYPTPEESEEEYVFKTYKAAKEKANARMHETGKLWAIIEID